MRYLRPLRGLSTTRLDARLKNIPCLVGKTSSTVPLQRRKVTSTTSSPQDASDDVMPGAREYFYTIDVHGQLFLEETKIKNFTSCFKDKAFLDFFFLRVRANRTGRHVDYPWVSPCGKELNFIKSEDVPIVFTELKPKADGTHVLCWGGAMEVVFDPSKIYSSPIGYLYHPSPTAVKPPRRDLGLPQLALIKSAVCLSHLAQALSGGDNFEWQGKTYPVNYLDREVLGS